MLQRVVYGLREADRQWSLRLSRVLLQKTDMEQSKADPCVFRKVVDGEVTHALLYAFMLTTKP